jgi:hypothetical protein
MPGCSEYYSGCDGGEDKSGELPRSPVRLKAHGTNDETDEHEQSLRVFGHNSSSDTRTILER